MLIFKSLAKSIVNNLSFQVSFDDLLPHVICSSCLELLKTSCELRNLIRSSDITLREMLLKDANKKDDLDLKPIDNATQVVVHTYT
jgi:hypothetical protein